MPNARPLTIYSKISDTNRSREPPPVVLRLRRFHESPLETSRLLFRTRARDIYCGETNHVDDFFCEEQTIKCQNGAIRDLSYLNIIAFVLSHIDTNSITGAQAGFEHALHW